MSESKTLILIDGHALAFREYFALERTGMKTTDNQPSWAVYGFFKAVFDLLKNKTINPDAIAVAFDVGRQTFRVEKYDQYKANRETMPDTLRSQMGLIMEGLKAFNIPIYTKEGFEADDVIGTICDKASKLGHKTLILTGDQDSFQLIDRDGKVKVLIPSKGELVEYDWYKVYEKLGVYPSQVVDYKGLRGDSSDNIPGIRGIGEKTAQKLLAQYRTMDNLFEHCEEIEGNSIRQKICDGKEIGKLSQELATIVKDVDINFDFEKTHIDLPEISQVSAFLQKMQFYNFLKNINEILCTFDKNCKEALSEANSETASQNPSNSILAPTQQLGLFAQEVQSQINKDNHNFEINTITTETQLNELVENLKKQKLISLDTETTGINFQEAELVGISLAYEENENYKAFYIPVFHLVGEQLDLEVVKNSLKPIFEDKNIHKTLQNAKFDYNILRYNGINLKGITFDTMLASYIKDPSRKHGLKTQALEHLNHFMQEITELIGTGKNQVTMETVSIENASNYACDDAYATLALTKYWKENLDEKELKLLYDVEVPLSLVLADMEYTGVSIDKDYLRELSDRFTAKIEDLETKIFEIAGEKFNVNSPKQVGEILFEKLAIPCKKKRGKNKFSTNIEVLEDLAQENKICEYIIEHRKFSKLKSTYTDALPQLTSPVDNRIHTSYNQTITTTGRLSSSNPNLQNIPARTQEGNQIRKAFIPKDLENGYLLSADYSQIELRLLAHISKDDNLIEAFCNGEDIHTQTAAKIFEVPIEGVTKEMRYKAKAVNFGIIYGQSKYGLSKAIGIAPFAAEIFIEKYFATYPKVKEYMNNTIRQVHEIGYVETMFGRKRYLFNDISSPNRNIQESAERAAINQPIQGAAADLVKIAMVDLDKKFRDKNLKSKMILQVHDELVIDVAKDELEIVKKLTKEAMELNQPLLVPLIVDMNEGKNWKED